MDAEGVERGDQAEDHLALTAHAATRMAQRAIATDDVELIGLIGTEVEGGYFVRTKDFQVLDRELKRLRDRARRLVGKRLVVEDGLIVTGYHARRGKERRLLRGAEERSLAARDPRIRF